MFVFQESEKGSWHVPSAQGSSYDSSRTWLCITRSSGHDAVATVSNSVDASGNGQLSRHHNLLDPQWPLRCANGVCSLDSQADENNTTSLTGKRKERSPSS